MANIGPSPEAATVPRISDDEVALYDRQIRLWGMKAQERIRDANVLLITMKGFANEVAKNLVLAGVGSITLLDDQVVDESDLGAQFLLSEVPDAAGRNRAQAASEFLQRLNPRVRVVADAEGFKTKPMGFFAPFNIVIATDMGSEDLNVANTAARLHGNAFYAAGVHGIYGFIFADLIEHDYVEKRDVSNVAVQVGPESQTRSVIDLVTTQEGDKKIEIITRREKYSTWTLASDVAGLPTHYLKSKRLLKGVTPILSCLRALWDFEQTIGRYPSLNNQDDLRSFTTMASTKHKGLRLPADTLTPASLRKFLQNVGCEIAPVTAILGGQLAQDVINVLGRSQPPIQNMVVFDGDTMTSDMYTLHPEGKLGRELLSDVRIDPEFPVPGSGGGPPVASAPAPIA